MQNQQPETDDANKDKKMLPRICHLFRLKYVLLGLFVIFLLDFFGAFTHMFEKDFHASFDYPLNDPNIPHYAKQLRKAQKPDLKPTNLYNYTYLSNCRQKCRDEGDSLIVPRLVIIVKSAMNHFSRRNAIRQSWGFEKRFYDVTIRTVFTLGITKHETLEDENLQTAIDKEREQYDDIIQADFIDSYFNNTIKTMMGLRWAIEYCPRSRFFMFVDDDFYISTKNVLRFLRNPVNYPEYLEDADETLRKLARRLSQSDMLMKNQSLADNKKELIEIQDVIDKNAIHTIDGKNHMNKIKEYLAKAETLTQNDRKGRQLLDTELPYDVRLFAGYVFSSNPHRHKSSKWYVSLDEYKWHKWPTYVTAGSFILSREALIEIYYTSMYTKHFRFDDIYLGIVALKANIEPLHSEEFYFYKANYIGPQSYRYVIATHGYDDPNEMLRVWTELKASGHA
ncbi:beta-1,3-galactosyltransferase brn [Contarinia nasturtii]|uniref:beta-1,3-galactosyltransferase brn n=1 Tax=Contarinia nasturtii TaxID=265458 RepID=UPI0012D38082|nr:beta-1,3-galactosyltransferase brn [Contarinia nasturtii]